MGKTTKKGSWFEHAQLMGEIGETKAIEHLEKLGFKILRREFHGPFDILAERDSAKFMVEVKYGASAVSIDKVRRLVEHAENDGCIPLLLFIDEKRTYIFKYTFLEDTIDIEEIKKCLGGYPKEIVLYLDGGQVVRWRRIA